MTSFRTFIASVLTILIVGLAPLATASAQPAGNPGRGWGLGLELNPGLTRGPRPRDEDVFEIAAVSCSGAAADAAAQTGGQVLSVSSREQGGQTVCVVTLLVPGKEGGRPRKTTVTIPL